MFTQKHYEFLSKFLKYELEAAVACQEESFKRNTSIPMQHRDSARVNALRGVIRRLGAELQRDSKSFDINRWYRTCGLGEVG